MMHQRSKPTLLILIPSMLLVAGISLLSSFIITLKLNTLIELTINIFIFIAIIIPPAVLVGNTKNSGMLFSIIIIVGYMLGKILSIALFNI